MEGPDDEERDPVHGGQTEPFRPTRRSGDRVDQQRHGGRGKIDLHAIPEHRHGRAQDAGQLGPGGAHAGTRKNRIGNAITFARRARQVHQNHDKQAGGDQRCKRCPAADMKGNEQRRNQRIAEKRLDIVGPDVEDREPAPGFLGAGDRLQRITALLQVICVCRIHVPFSPRSMMDQTRISAGLLFRSCHLLFYLKC